MKFKDLIQRKCELEQKIAIQKEQEEKTQDELNKIELAIQEYKYLNSPRSFF